MSNYFDHLLNFGDLIISLEWVKTYFSNGVHTDTVSRPTSECVIDLHPEGGVQSNVTSLNFEK